MIRLLILLLVSVRLLQSDPTLSAVLTPRGVLVSWTSEVVVCPWLEDGSFVIYAGTTICSRSGVSMLSYVPNDGASIVLRDENGRELARRVLRRNVMILPIVMR